MARKAVISDGVVDNVIEADDDFTLPGKTLIASDTANIGDIWDGSAFTPPAPPPAPVPESVSRRQAKRALLAAGLLSTVEAAVAGASAEVQIDWTDAIEFRRDNALIASMAVSLGLTSAQIDDLFRSAATL